MQEEGQERYFGAIVTKLKCTPPGSLGMAAEVVAGLPGMVGTQDAADRRDRLRVPSIRQGRAGGTGAAVWPLRLQC
jgi:precorrin isomerase